MEKVLGVLFNETMDKVLILSPDVLKIEWSKVEFYLPGGKLKKFPGWAKDLAGYYVSQTGIGVPEQLWKEAIRLESDKERVIIYVAVHEDSMGKISKGLVENGRSFWTTWKPLPDKVSGLLRWVVPYCYEFLLGEMRNKYIFKSITREVCL